MKINFFLVRIQVERKFQRKKQVVPGEYDVKIYMRMAVLAGFGWTIGFILFALPDSQQGFLHYLAVIFKYLFILLNATPGLFIFVVYVCNRRVFALYHRLFTRLIQSKYQTVKEFILNQSQIYFNQAKYHLNKVFYKKKQQDIPTTSNPSETLNNTILRPSLSESSHQPLPEKQSVKRFLSIP
jgi:hypothetical protein